uniref:Ephrin B2 n=1 Tax=Poecilia reticulata TaxID=8081 RepID=A0A3P9QDP5_POERE
MGGRARSCGAVILLISLLLTFPRFTPGQGLVLYPQIGDKMDIVCPRADPSSGRTEEFYKVYLVTKSQMESCGVAKTDTPLLNCDKPDQDVKFTFKFQEFSPNLWGLEFLKGRDYYITSTSTGSLRGLDNTKGGACRTKSMKLVLRVGQSKQHVFILVFTNKDVHTHTHTPTRTHTHTFTHIFMFKEMLRASCIDLYMEAFGLSFFLLLQVEAADKYPPFNKIQQPHQPPASVSLSTLAVPKRDSFSSDNDGSDRSEVVFPLRPSESMICRHYERVSGEYGPPVYIVQEIMPQSPTNVYYKV